MGSVGMPDAQHQVCAGFVGVGTKLARLLEAAQKASDSRKGTRFVRLASGSERKMGGPARNNEDGPC